MRFLTLSFLFVSTIVFSQDKIKHTVVKGETIYSITKKYDIKESELLDLNPKVKSSSLQLNMILWIPNKNNSVKDNPREKSKNQSKEITNLTITHQVLAKETLYGISKKYSTTVDKIKEANSSITGEGIKVGNTLTIPVSKEVFALQPKASPKVETPIALPKVQKKQETVSQNTDEAITHHVVAKETKYGISKQYNISIAELEKLNPHIIKGLSIDDDLIIRPGKTKAVAVTVIKKEKDDILPAQPIGENKTEVPLMSADAKSKAEFLISKASENIGVPYHSGGTDKNGFDCSGLIFTTFKEIDMLLPRSSSDMAANAGIKIDRTQAQKGDLIFFDTMNRGNVSHVGMITEVSEDEIKFIHSSTSSGVMISSTREEYFAQRLVQINRVLEN